MRASAPLGVLVALATPAPSWALSLGDIELSSALNQPFRAAIGLSATADELETLRIRVADAVRFEQIGLDRPAFMSDLSFNVVNGPGGGAVIAVTSSRSIAEPFVTMIIEASWARGVLFREYTVLLDPPVLLPAPEVTATVTPAQRGSTSSAARVTPIDRGPAPAQQPVTAGPAPAPRATPAGEAGTYGPVQRSETLWQIAQRYQPAGATINQTMVAIYQANPQAFGGNINVLRLGAILRIPDQDELLGLSPANATAEVRRQNEDWRNRVDQPPRVVLLPPSESSGAPQIGAGGQAADAGANAELQDEVESLRAELEQSRRLIELRNQELSDLQEQLSSAAAADAAIAAVPEPATTDDSPQVFADPPAAADVAPEPVAVPEPEPVTADDSPRAIPSVTAPPPGPSLLSRIGGWLANPIAWLIAGGGVLIAALLFMRRRRETEFDDDATGEWDAIEAGMEHTQLPPEVAPIESSEESSDVDSTADAPFVVEERPQSSTTRPLEDAEEVAAGHYAQASADLDARAHDDTLSTSGVLNLDEADPVAEADFHMAYGLYDQAAELLTTELRKDPERRDLQLKLLEVYFVWGNKAEFLDAAEHLHENLEGRLDGDWDKVLIMGKQICPDAPLFSESASGAASVDVPLADDDESALDFPFGDGDDNAIALDIGDATQIGNAPEFSGDEIDLDLTGNREGPSFGSTDILDVGARTAANLEEAFKDTQDDDETEIAPPGVDPESLVATQETPQLDEGEFDDDGMSGLTIESPTVTQAVEGGAADDATVEMSTDSAQLGETAVIDGGIRDTTEAATANESGAAAAGTEYTAEIDVNELGLDVEAVDALPDDLDSLVEDLGAAASAADDGDTQEQPALDVEIDPDFLSATGITQVLQDDVIGDLGAGDESKVQQLVGESAGTQDTQRLDPSTEETGEIDSAGATDPTFEADLDELSKALDEDATVEQATGGGTAEIAPDSQFVDLDIGEEMVASEEPTGTEDMRAVDPQTLTEVGTKLDLARAYIDMGDPDGAKSILEEVLAEGDKGQRDEAQNLMQAIGE